MLPRSPVPALGARDSRDARHAGYRCEPDGTAREALTALCRRQGLRPPKGVCGLRK
jgi:hypothetical protein